jgi:phosphohistidine phosphatase SixA
MLCLIFVRHGDYSRTADGGDLTERGTEQSRAIGEILAELYPDVGLILSSPLSRAQQTASHIKEKFGAAVALEKNDNLGEDKRADFVIQDMPRLSSQFGTVVVVTHLPVIKDCSKHLGGPSVEPRNCEANIFTFDETDWAKVNGVTPLHLCIRPN